MSEQPGDRNLQTATCPHCGSEMVSGTVDLAETPDVTQERDEQRSEFNPGEMVAVSHCPNPDCHGGAGAQV